MNKVKALRVSDFPEEAWVVFGEGGSAADKSLEELYGVVDYLYRGVTLRAQKLSSVPFVIMKGKRTFFDSEHGAPPPKGFAWFDDLSNMLELIEAATCLSGRAYVRPIKSNYNLISELQWFLPTSVQPKFTDTGDIAYWERQVSRGNTERLKAEEVLYFWPPDPTVEVGPARRFDGKAAMKAAGVLANMDTFLEAYFSRGAIKVTLLTTDGVVTKENRALLKDWWGRVTGGISKAFGAEVINAGKVTPVVIGEGIKDLENTALTNEKREAICAALGVPPSKMLPSAANYATKQSDDVMLVSDTIVPELRWIGRALNKQLFNQMGLSIVFQPESLSEMQVDENERAASLVSLTSAGMPLLLACEVLGYNLPDEWMKKLEDEEARKEEMRESAAAGLQLAQQAAEQQQGQPQIEATEQEEKSIVDSYKLGKRMDEAARFERWLRNDTERDPADFVSDILTDEEKLHIKAIVDGRLQPNGRAGTTHAPSGFELSDPDELDRIVRSVERWAKKEGLDLDKMLEAEVVDNS